MNLFSALLTVSAVTAILCSSPALRATEDNGTLFPSVLLPQVGDCSLHILSPDTLELVRINSKPAGTSTVPDSWNFVANGVFTSPDTSRFSVMVDDVPVAVTGVHFRRRTAYAPLKTRDLRID